MIPNTYQEVEYIEASGAQYSAINFNMLTGDTLNVDVYIPSAAGTSEAAAVGADFGSGKAEIYHQSNQIKFYSRFSGTSFNISRDTKYTATASVTGDLTGFYVGAYQPTRYFYVGRIYALNIVRNNTIVCNLVPCYRISDSVIGFYDDVNNAFYTNAGSGSYTKGPDVSHDYYTLSFNANGGEGVMADQNVLINTYDYIQACDFTKAGYVFSGWALSASGAVVYGDGAQIYNIAEIGETVDLYAVWEKPHLEFILQTNNSENNKAVKSLNDIRTVRGTLKDRTSIIDPVLVLALNIEDVRSANYLTIPAFGRSYFITGVESIRNGIIEISAHVDVLSSFISELRECDAIIHRQQTKWNLYLDDGIFKTYQNPHIVVKKFPSGFTTQSFVLAVAGD